MLRNRNSDDTYEKFISLVLVISSCIVLLYYGLGGIGDRVKQIRHFHLAPSTIIISKRLGAVATAFLISETYSQKLGIL